MPRSPEGLERHRAAIRKWHQAHPDYKRNWDREHALSERERKRIYRERNRDRIREARRRYYLEHPRSAHEPEPLPRKFEGHPFFDTARFICGNEPYWDASVWVWEEAMAEATLAQVEERDPNAAVVATWARERDWKYHTGPLYGNVDVQEDTRRVVIIRRRSDATT